MSLPMKIGLGIAMGMNPGGCQVRGSCQSPSARTDVLLTGAIPYDEWRKIFKMPHPLSTLPEELDLTLVTLADDEGILTTTTDDEGFPRPAFAKRLR